MGSSASAPTDPDGTITIPNTLVAEHLQKLRELEKENEKLRVPRYTYLNNEVCGDLLRKVETLTMHNRNLKSENDQLRSTNTTLKNTNTVNINALDRLKLQNAQHQSTIDELTIMMKETEDKLSVESKQMNAKIRMLTNELKQIKDAKDLLKKRSTHAKVQKDQLERELTQLKKSNLLVIQSSLDDLNKRADAVSSQIIKHVKNDEREKYIQKCKTLKDANDRMISNLRSVTFTTRFHQDNHNALIKLQKETDQRCMDTLKHIHEISKDCKTLMTDYNTTIPTCYLKAIADHTRDLDLLEKTNFSAEFKKEKPLQDDILNSLLKEKDILENILNVERSSANSNKQANNDKPNNVEYLNNLTSNDPYVLVVRNMEEASDTLDDIIKFETFICQRINRKIFISGVERIGVLGKTPRAAKVTLKSLVDVQDVLNSKHQPQEYKHIYVENPNQKKKRTRNNKNVNVEQVNK